MADAEALRMEAGAIRETGLLGRSEPLRRLFDYLTQSSIEDRSPKEAEVAAAVFGRRADFDTSQDAVVRVYVHKLRRKLEAIYAGPRKDSPTHLTIPRGEYRLVVEAAPEAVAEPRPTGSFALMAAAALALMAVSSAATWLVLRPELSPALREVNVLRAGPVWSPLLRDRFPTLIVVGDYYIFGDSDDGMDVNRLVREYTVNSRADLDGFLMQHPDKASHYVDLDLRYLPVGAAYALRSVLPMIDGGRGSGADRVVLASDVTPRMLKTNNIVYIGYFSALGVLRDVAFAGSRYSIGETYDQIVDHRGKRTYESQGGGPDSDGDVYRDYGYFSTFKGPNGNRIVIVAGTRDVALMQTAEAVTGVKTLKDAVARGGDPDAFEALYEVDGMNRQNVDGRLLQASPLDAGRIWNGAGQKAQFPAG
jgi:hypothetical protein